MAAGDDQIADVIILGGGCAGLALARELANRQFGGEVIIFEPRREYTDDRSWCFWADPGHPDTRLARHRWRRWESSVRCGPGLVRLAGEIHY